MAVFYAVRLNFQIGANPFRFRLGSTAVDDLAWASEQNVLIAITCKPYRREVVDAVRIAREQGVTVIGISDNALGDLNGGYCFHEAQEPGLGD